MIYMKISIFKLYVAFSWLHADLYTEPEGLFFSNHFKLRKGNLIKNKKPPMSCNYYRDPRHATQCFSPWFFNPRWETVTYKIMFSHSSQILIYLTVNSEIHKCPSVLQHCHRYFFLYANDQMFTKDLIYNALFFITPLVYSMYLPKGCPMLPSGRPLSRADGGSRRTLLSTEIDRSGYQEN